MVGEEKEPRFDFLIPYGTYMKEKTRRYKKDIQHASNWTYEERDDRQASASLLSYTSSSTKKSWSGNSTGSLQLFYFRDLLDSPFYV
jgi:hypothetical protein